MKRVEFYALKGTDDALAGTISWDAEREEFSCDPDEEWLREVLTETLRDPKTGKPVTSDGDPDRWLSCLQYTYRSYALRAAAPVGGGSEEEGGGEEKDDDS